MTVVIDQGNSSAKIGIFERRVLQEKYSIEKTEELVRLLKNFSGEGIIISSVNTELQIDPSLLSQFAHVINLSWSTPLPVENRYGSKSTLGMDRIAAVCGARELFGSRNCLVIDAGTCITYDFLSSEGDYLGGSISPGLAMRFRAMHTFTSRLPLVEPVQDPPLTGDSTVSCMQSGVFFGLIDEINGVIDRYSKIYPVLQVILCGGDTAFFENKLKASIFASPELVLKGLNSILLHNVNS
jgi:type III pantothenate kinase